MCRACGTFIDVSCLTREQKLLLAQMHVWVSQTCSCLIQRQEGRFRQRWETGDYMLPAASPAGLEAGIQDLPASKSWRYRQEHQWRQQQGQSTERGESDPMLMATQGLRLSEQLLGQLLLAALEPDWPAGAVAAWVLAGQHFLHEDSARSSVTPSVL